MALDCNTVPIAFWHTSCECQYIVNKSISIRQLYDLSLCVQRQLRPEQYSWVNNYVIIIILYICRMRFDSTSQEENSTLQSLKKIVESSFVSVSFSQDSFWDFFLLLFNVCASYLFIIFFLNLVRYSKGNHRPNNRWIVVRVSWRSAIGDHYDNSAYLSLYQRYILLYLYDDDQDF